LTRRESPGGRTLEAWEATGRVEATIDNQAEDRTALAMLWRRVAVGLVLTIVIAALVVLVAT
jgi:hypothetical protein